MKFGRIDSWSTTIEAIRFLTKILPKVHKSKGRTLFVVYV